MTTILDAVGAALVVSGVFVVFGLGASLLVGGAAVLLVSWNLSRGGKA